MTRMVHQTDRVDFLLESVDTAGEGAGIWLYPLDHSQEWEGRYEIEFELEGDWRRYEYQRFECGLGEWCCKEHESIESEKPCDRILVECFVPAADFLKLKQV